MFLPAFSNLDIFHVLHNGESCIICMKLVMVSYMDIVARKPDCCMQTLKLQTRLGDAQSAHTTAHKTH